MKALILGDVCPSKVTRDSFKRKETEKLFGDFIDVMKSSEFTFVNLIFGVFKQNGITYCVFNSIPRYNFSF